MRPYGFMPSGRFSVFMGQLRVILARSPAPVPFPAGFVSVTCQPTTETEVYMAIINLRNYYPFYPEHVVWKSLQGVQTDDIGHQSQHKQLK